MNNYLYLKVKKDLLKRIESGEFSEDNSLPSEKELCKFYKVSQITIRRAVGELTNENILIRRQGKGTFLKETEKTTQLKTILALLPLATNTFFYDEFYGPVWKGMEEEANLSGCNLVFSTHSSSLKHKRDLLKTINSDMHAGIMVINEMDNQLLHMLQDKLPVVLVDYSLTDFFSVVSDNEGGALDATQHLISSGHKKIACLTVPSISNSYPLRVRGYKNALKLAHIDEALIFQPDEDPNYKDTGLNAMESLGYKTCKKNATNPKENNRYFCGKRCCSNGSNASTQREKYSHPRRCKYHRI